MKVRCKYNTGQDLRRYENKLLKEEELGRFGTTANSIYGEITVGREYLVMGMIMFESYLSYLVDDDGLISACPCQLFEVVDDKVDPKWHFRLIEKEEDIYPYIQAIWGYYELCFDRNSYEKLIVEKAEDVYQTYFKRKNTSNNIQIKAE